MNRIVSEIYLCVLSSGRKLKQNEKYISIIISSPAMLDSWQDTGWVLEDGYIRGSMI